MLFRLLNNEMTEDEYLQENNIKVVYKKMPKKVYGFIHRYRDINIIIINWNLSKTKKMKTLLHEFAHLELNHLEKDNPLFAFYIENADDEAEAYLEYINEYIIKHKEQMSEIYKNHGIKE